MSRQMNPEQLEKLFSDALEHKDGLERSRFLDRACEGDAELRQRAEKLIKAHEKAANFLSDPSRHTRSQHTLAERTGDTIGHYKLLEPLGEGGCGVVYMAEQEEPVRRRVALKVIKLGMDTRQVIARFEGEQQALALMDHSNIAKVFDAGATETGRPYFVMELVRGVKLTEFCDENKLPTQERLKLFVQVCQAIQHAHQKGVIHRDIKPSNVLVTSHDVEPVIKVIDFGIAKATQGRLTDQTLFTAFEQFLGTPAYMSPEQAAMTSVDVDTRSDIYSLGILLYELLTGRTPFDPNALLEAGLDGMRRTIQEQQPPKPSTQLGSLTAEELTMTARRRHTEGPKLLHVVRGDLDWIVMKCLEKDRARRYETASGLAADIVRHLNLQTVTARPPSKIYEIQKTVRRHKFGFAAAAALILVLMLGVAGSTWQAIRATQAEREQARLRKEAVSEKLRSEQVAKFLTEMLRAAGPSVAQGRDATLLLEILKKTSDRIQTELANEPQVRGDLWANVGMTYSDIGEMDLALRSQACAVADYQLAFPTNHSSLALALGKLGSLQSYKGNIAEGSSNAWLGLAMARQLGDDETLASSLILYANSLNDWGKGAAAGVPYLREAVAIRERLGVNDSLASAYHTLSTAVTNLAEATELARKVLTYSLQHRGPAHTETASRRFLLGQHLLAGNQPEEAEVELRAALESWRKLYPPTHPYRAIVYRFLVQSLLRQNKIEVLEREAVEESRNSTTNRDPALIRLAAKIARGELPPVPMEHVQALESKINKSAPSFNAAIAQARAGQMDEHRRITREMVRRAGQKRDRGPAEQAAKAALLFPSDPATVAAAADLADLAATVGAGDGLAQWAYSTKALAEYRRGNFLNAIEAADRALADRTLWKACEAMSQCVRALAFAGLGDETKARAALDCVVRAEMADREFIVLRFWQLGELWAFRDWTIANFLKTEAEAKLRDTFKGSQSSR